MRVLKIKVRASFGRLNLMPQVIYTGAAPGVYFSTIQGILSRLSGETIYYEDLEWVGVRYNYDRNNVRAEVVRQRIASGGRIKTRIRKFEVIPNIKLDIYVPVRFRGVIEENAVPIYAFSPDFLADYTVEEVELVPIETAVEGATRLSASGTYFNRLVHLTSVFYGAIEFNYCGTKRLEPRYVGPHYYVNDNVLISTDGAGDTFGDRRFLDSIMQLEGVYVDRTNSAIVQLFNPLDMPGVTRYE